MSIFSKFFRSIGRNVSFSKDAKQPIKEIPSDLEMMYHNASETGLLTRTSIRRLKTCHPYIQTVVLDAAEELAWHDLAIMVVEGVRPESKQQEYLATGASRVKYPMSYHNSKIGMSLAVDLAPLTSDGRQIDWNNEAAFKQIAAQMDKSAKKFAPYLSNQDTLPVRLRWGYDLWSWDMPHYQLNQLSVIDGVTRRMKKNSAGVFYCPYSFQTRDEHTIEKFINLPKNISGVSFSNFSPSVRDSES